MGLLSKVKSAVKKVSKAIDPTNPNSPLGGVVRSGLSVVPGGGAALAAIDQAAKLNSAAKKAAAPKPVPPPGPVAPTSATATAAAVMTSPGGISVGLLAAAGLVLLLILKRK